MMLSRATRYKGLDALIEIAAVIVQRGRRDIVLLALRRWTGTGGGPPRQRELRASMQ